MEEPNNIDPFTLHPSSYQADFVAKGKSDTWKLSIIMGQQVIFTSKDGAMIFRTTDPAQTTPNVAAGADILNFNLKNKDAKLNITIDVASCKGSGNIVNIEYESDSEKFNDESCGEYTGDFRIAALWNLEKINNEAIDKSIFRRQPPFFDINIMEGKVGGNAGCNTFGGQLRYVYNAFYVDYITATRMYCDDESPIEEEILNIIRDEKIMYQIKENVLILETKKGTLEFSKVE